MDIIKVSYYNLSWLLPPLICVNILANEATISAALFSDNEGCMYRICMACFVFSVTAVFSESTKGLPKGPFSSADKMRLCKELSLPFNPLYSSKSWPNRIVIVSP